MPDNAYRQDIVSHTNTHYADSNCQYCQSTENGVNYYVNNNYA